MTRDGQNAAAALAVLLALLGTACSEQVVFSDAADAAFAGGDTTVFDETIHAFELPARNLDRDQRTRFAVGNSLFTQNWVTAPASTEMRDGLGPLLNAPACSSCHPHDGRGRPRDADDATSLGLLLRISVPDGDGGFEPDPFYGDQIQDRGILGVPPEASVRIERTPVLGQYADGTPFELRRPTYFLDDPAYGDLPGDLVISPRVGPAMVGLALLEAVPEEVVLALADPEDADGDGVSGRANRVMSVRAGALVLGRFGWKANQPTIEQQVAGAFLGDIGVTTPLFPDANCTVAQEACQAAPNGGSPELDEERLGKVAFYASVLAVPARRDLDDAAVLEGERLFERAGCAACHVPTLETGPHVIEALAGQTIHPYTDLLLHDLGPELADGRPDGLADGREWRTAPLWGIGLVDTVNGHTRFLHDGRARSLEEAILWHGGEAEAAREDFVNASAEERVALLRFLESL